MPQKRSSSTDSLTNATAIKARANVTTAKAAAKANATARAIATAAMTVTAAMTANAANKASKGRD